MSRVAPVLSPNIDTKVTATLSQLTDEQILSAIRDLDPGPGGEQSGDHSTVLAIWFILLILLIGTLAIIWLYLRTYQGAYNPSEKGQPS